MDSNLINAIAILIGIAYAVAGLLLAKPRWYGLFVFVVTISVLIFGQTYSPYAPDGFGGLLAMLASGYLTYFGTKEPTARRIAGGMMAFAALANGCFIVEGWANLSWLAQYGGMLAAVLSFVMGVLLCVIPGRRG